MELKEGMYVRTNHHHEHVVRKIMHIYEDPKEHDHCLVFDKPTKYTYYVEDNNFIAKENPIGLIEVGDYVNGSKVLKIERNKVYLEEFEGANVTDMDFEEHQLIGYCIEPDYITSEQIKSIVTKEQFEQMSYKMEVKNDR